MPISIFIAVVFPAPFAPKNPNISPFLTSKVMEFTAVKSPNFLVRFSTSMTLLFFICAVYFANSIKVSSMVVFVISILMF